MVSLKDRSEYLTIIKHSPKAQLFHDFLFSESAISTNSDFTKDPSDKLFFDLLLSLQTNNPELFNASYTEVSKRKPSPESPFVNDDFLTFCLVVGVKKFILDNQWVLKVINSRNSQNEETNEIIQTFKNLLNDNYKSNDNNNGITMVFQFILLKELITGPEKSDFYKKIIKLEYPMYRSDFLNLVSLKAFDLILDEQILSGTSNSNVMTEKLARFSMKVKSISVGLYTAIYLIIFSTVSWAIISGKASGWFEYADTLFGVLGFAGLLGNFFQRKKVIGFLESRITNFFLG